MRCERASLTTLRWATWPPCWDGATRPVAAALSVIVDLIGQDKFERVRVRLQGKFGDRFAMPG